MDVELPAGTCPAEEFLAGMDARALAQFDALLGRLTEIGWLRSPELLRNLQLAGEPKVWEVKAHTGRGHRLYLVWRAPTGSPLTAGPKASDRRVKTEVRRDIYKKWTA